MPFRRCAHCTTQGSPPRKARLPTHNPALHKQLDAAVQALATAQRPVLYGGGGLVNSGLAACAAFTRLADATAAPCTLTLMGLGAFPASHRQWLGMLGMHGSLEANRAMHHPDLIVCVGARFDDRVTGRLEDFSPQAKVVHIDIDPGSINKVVRTDVPLLGDCAQILRELGARIEWRCIDSDEHPGAVHRRAAPHAGQGRAVQQRLHGHGPPVAGNDPRQTLQPQLHRRAAALPRWHGVWPAISRTFWMCAWLPKKTAIR